ncbi:unnamed protein product [Caenorhabditis angaria]|uniref:G-protein coupled receptors family 1 profile domain-containing protein n=1 Tax=Caenorhabditis angaria TaxID=860376 RepID=A0A9P1IXE7_9PELO|nr:unnamed protein product [Caenorhabditis angaria]
MNFFWILLQLLIAVSILSILNLTVNVPVTLFSLLTTEFVKSEVFVISSYVIDFCNYAILFANLVIAIQRGTVFLFPQRYDLLFKTSIMVIWISLIWAIPMIIVCFMYYNECSYEYITKLSHYSLRCANSTRNPKIISFFEILIQILVPLINLTIYVLIIIKIFVAKQSNINKKEMSVLKQAITIFMIFQISSTLFYMCLNISFNLEMAFVFKRLLNAILLIAGTATPCYFFFTSPDIKKLFTKKVSVHSSNMFNSRRISVRASH